jgi:hypothetical protein
VALAYAYPLELWGAVDSAGISGKYVRSEIITSAATLTSDLGLLSSPCHLGGMDLRLSFVAQNLGGRLKFYEEAAPLPLNIKLGGALAVTENWLTALDVNFPKDNRPYVVAGAEYRLNYDADLGFAGRAGFNSRTIGDINGLNGLSLGAGVNFKRFRLDYACLPVGSIGVTHTISVTFGFAKPEPSREARYYRKANKAKQRGSKTRLTFPL